MDHHAHAGLHAKARLTFSELNLPLQRNLACRHRECAMLGCVGHLPEVDVRELPEDEQDRVAEALMAATTSSSRFVIGQL